MQSYLVSYAHSSGFGRQLFGINGLFDQAMVFEVEAKIAEGLGNVSIIAISKIDGEVTPKEQPE